MTIRSCCPTRWRRFLRWVTPISHFTRTATEDCTVRGEGIGAGEQVALYFASANRDEDVFGDPFAFRVVAARTRISRSASVSTSAWARRSRTSSSRRSSACCSRASIRSRYPDRRTTELHRQRQHQAPADQLPNGLTDGLKRPSSVRKRRPLVTGRGGRIGSGSIAVGDRTNFVPGSSDDFPALAPVETTQVDAVTGSPFL